MKLLIVAGGGGHFAAALAVIQELPKDWELMVVGRQYAFEADRTPSLESQTAKKLGINFKSITAGRLQRKFSPQSLQSLVKVPGGYIQARTLVKEYKPDIVLSFGGYVSVPVCLAAWNMKVPVIVHEQIFGAGLANKIVGKFAKKICISWEQSRKFFPTDKVVFTGNPIKKMIRHSGEQSDSRIPNTGFQRDSGRTSFARMTEEKLPIIYVTGGSGGSHAINVLIELSLEQLLKKYVVIHQTGNAQEYGDFDRIEKKKDSLDSKLQKRYMITKFVDPHDVFGILEKADLVVARSGINTVTELLSFGKPALFIPLPHGQHNEQLTNAMFVKQIGLCEIAHQKDLTSDDLVSLINTMIENIVDYQKNSADAKKLIHEDAAQKIVSLLI